MTEPTTSRRMSTTLAGVSGLAMGVTIGFLAGRSRSPALDHYGETHDYVRSHFVRDVGDDELVEHSLKGLAHGIDEYSEYYGAAELAQIERDTTGRYHGLGMVMSGPAGGGRVLYAYPDSPAHKGGVCVGDLIESVDGRTLDGTDVNELRALLTTRDPRDVVLGVQGLDGTRRELELRTASVLEPTLKHELMLDASRGIGYVAFSTFTHETSGEFDAAVERLQRDGLRALVIDLRGNPGGILNAAVSIARRFVPEGVIVSTEGRGAPIVHEADAAQTTLLDLPLVVLVDGGSASASEVLAAALQDHRAAVLVGDSTWGKGMVQTLHHFSDAAIKLTTSYYYTPAGKNLEHSADPAAPRGLQPDVLVRVSDSRRRVLHRWLARGAPPSEALERLRAWERSSGNVLVEPRPADPQLDAAVSLLAGDRPTAWASREAP